MLEIKTVEDAKALEGQTFGSGKNTRIVTRLENLSQGPWSMNGDVYWKRPGGTTRKLPQFLSYFVAWVNKTERNAKHDAKRTLIDTTLGDLDGVLDNYFAGVHIATQIKGFIVREGNEVTISFKLK